MTAEDLQPQGEGRGTRVKNYSMSLLLQEGRTISYVASTAGSNSITVSITNSPMPPINYLQNINIQAFL